MRLLNVGAGEISDRLSILALKVLHGEQAGKDVSHFVNERNGLIVQFRTASTDAGLEHLFTLAAVNAMLWHAEDDLRAWRRMEEEKGIDTMDAPKVITVAFRIQELNDQRAELVWTLNKLAGTDLGREKLND